MAYPEGETQEHPARPTAYRAVLTATLLFVLAAVFVSAGLVVYTAWLHDLKDGLFALLFGILSARAALSWVLWHHSYQPSADGEGRKPTNEALP